MSTLILGIGNNLLQDDGAGVHVVRFLQEHHGGLPGVRYLDGGTLSFTLAEELAGARRLVVVDAARLGGQAGEVRCFEDQAMDDFLRGKRKSVHEVGLTDLLDISRLSDSMPERRALVGIEPLAIDWGEDPSPPVQQAIPRAARIILELVARWDSQAREASE